MSSIYTIFTDVWNKFFGVVEPHLGISFGSIYLGVFVVGVSLRVLMPLIGVGGAGFNSTVGSLRRGRGETYRQFKRRRERNNSYQLRFAREHNHNGN